MSYETLDIAIGEDRIGVVTLSRPDARNAMSTRMMEELGACFAGLYVNPDAAACLILTGAGTAFCAGADLKERKGMPDDVWCRQHAVLERMVRGLMDCPVPVIAAV